MGTEDSIGGRTRLCGLIGNPVEHTLSPLIHNTLAQSCGRDMVYVPFFVEAEDSIGGRTRLCGLIGNPVEHTLSPLIHNTLAQSCGRDMVYVPFFVEDGRLGDAVKGAYALNVLGLNITVPYKTDVVPFLESIEPMAEAIGSVNTLVRSDGGYRGYNTDMSGLYRAMQEDGVELAGQKVAVLGAGGVGRAVAYLCAAKGAEQVVILNRSVDKAERIAAEVCAKTGRNVVSAAGLLEA